MAFTETESRMVVLWGSGSGELFNGFQFCKMERVLGMGGGESCTRPDVRYILPQ